jgi:hypothetical protein
MGRTSRRRAQSIRPRYPLPAERQGLPRTDCEYAGDGFAARFHPDGTFELGEETGTWSVDKRALYVSTPSSQGEGVIGITAVYLTCSIVNAAERIELELIAQESTAQS